MNDFATFNSDGWPWWTSPFNGQSRRIYNCCVLAAYLRPNFAIETGTYVGSSTYLLSGLGVQKTFSVEIDEYYAAIARKRHWQLIEEGHLEILEGSSKDLLPQILKGISTEDRTILYLDAHWGDYLPIVDEIKSLIDWGGVYLAIIDDFQVPNFLGYGFDAYGNSVVGPSAIPTGSGLSLWTPDENEKCETGARRGTGYLFSKHALDLIPKAVFKQLKLQEYKL